MSQLQTLHLAHLPPDLAIHIALYTNLRNASFLREQLLQGNPDFEYAFIDTNTIISTTHILAAVFRACTDSLNHRLKSRNVHSETVFSLGATNNIATTLRTHGLSPTTTNLLVIKISTLTTTPGITHDSVLAHLNAVVEGEMVAFCDEVIARMTDVGLVRKIYKLGGEGKSKRRRKDGGVEGSVGVGREDRGVGEGATREREGMERRELEVGVLGLMALRGAV